LPLVSNAQAEYQFFQPPRRPSAMLIGAVGLALVGAFFLGRSTAQGPGETQMTCPPIVSAPASAPGNLLPSPVTSGAEPNGARASDAVTPGRAPVGGTQTKAAFDPKAASRALKVAAARAGSCKRPGTPHGSAVVMVTFANTGRASSANVTGAPFSGTPTGDCIAALMRGTRVPAFAGEPVTVKKTISL
jgi:hypothetical protein